MKRTNALATVILLAAVLSGCGNGSSLSSKLEVADQMVGAAHGRAPKARRGVQPGEIPVLKLEGTKPSAEEKGPSRNLFSFEDDPVLVAKRKEEEAAKAKAAEEAAERVKVAQEKAREERAKLPVVPKPPAIRFQFIGYFGEPDKRIGVFAGNDGRDVLLASGGETIFTKFHVLDIGYESAEIGFDGFDETKRVPLTGGGK